MTPADLLDADVLVELRIFPAIGANAAVAGSFALVRAPDGSPNAVSQGAYVGLHEPPELLEEAIRSVAGRRAGAVGALDHSLRI